MRKYDDELGRFMSVDALWEKYRGLSPYNYCANSPMILLDPSGMGDEEIPSNYQGKEVLAPATFRKNPDGSWNKNAYNCHSYAWCQSNGDPNDPANSQVKGETPKWDNDPLNNAEQDAVRLSFDQPNKVGDRVVYVGVSKVQDENGKIVEAVIATHSAVVTAVDENGATTEVTSKWRQSELFSHHPRDVPASYGTQTPTFEFQGRTYPSRVYFRVNTQIQGIPGLTTPRMNERLD